MEKQKIQVQIFGTEYSLKSDMDEEYVRNVASYVDAKLRHFSDATSVKSSTKIAVLTALNIADELFRLKQKYETILAEIESKSKEVNENLERVFEQLTNS